MRQSVSSQCTGPLPLYAKILASAFLLLSLGFCLAWSHNKLFWTDELLEFYSDSRPSFAAVVAGQQHFPFSLEPPAFHLLLHGMQRLLPGHLELATRIPGIACLITLQFSVFLLVFRITRHPRAALIAMLFPFVLATVVFGPEARVYEVLAALFALALLAYQRFLCAADGHKALPLAGLAIALGAAGLLHYYGILLSAPFYMAELVRFIRRRHVDLAPPFALLASTALCGLNYPFFRGLHEIRLHYYTGQAEWEAVPFTYAWLVGHNDIYQDDAYGIALRTISFVLGFVVVPALIVLVVYRYRQRTWGSAFAPALLVALVAGALLPALNVGLASMGTQAYVPRYSVPAVASIAVLLALLFAPALRRWSTFLLATAALLAAGCWAVVQHMNLDGFLKSATLHDIADTADLQRALASSPDRHVYVQNVARFLLVYHYASPELQNQLVGFQSTDRELFWLHRTPASLFLRNMGCSTSLPVQPYPQLRDAPGPHLILVFSDPEEEWIGLDLFAGKAAAQVQPLGHALGGRLFRVTFRPPHAAMSSEVR